MNETELLQPARTGRRRVESVWIVAFIGLNLLAPFVFGERFPFTIAPMFCQEPTCFCEYEVTDARGREVSLQQLGLQRVYDGNPVGLGVGLRPPETLDEFGKVPTAEAVRDHLLNRLDAWPETPYLNVQVKVVGDVDGQHVGPTKSFEVKVERGQPE